MRSRDAKIRQSQNLLTSDAYFNVKFLSCAVTVTNKIVNITPLIIAYTGTGRRPRWQHKIMVRIIMTLCMPYTEHVTIV